MIPHAPRALAEASPGRPTLEVEDGGEVVFVPSEAILPKIAEALGRDALVARVGPLRAATRGQLWALVDEAVERELSQRGASSAVLHGWGVDPRGDREARLDDWLFRARSVGARALVVVIEGLAALGAPALELEDSRALLALASETRGRPLSLILDDAARDALAYTAPRPLGELLAAAAAPARVRRAADSSVRIAAVVVEARTDALVQAAAPADSPSAIAPEPPLPAATAPATRQAAGPPKAPLRAGAVPEEIWRPWTRTLASARGPQSLAAFERLFTDAYVPLVEAIERGLDDPQASKARDEFRAAFEHAYGDAFPTFAVTGKRPKLVMDAPDLAARAARLHGARATHILVVDALRWDLGERVRDELGRRASPSLRLAEQQMLWAALPTTTARQLDTIARGVDALRSITTAEGVESLRGRTADVPRRLKLGHRDVLKIDSVESFLASHARIDGSLLDDCARHVARLVLGVAESLAPRTLLYVVGDHGFMLDAHGAAHAGGASPEEVLVGGYAWLVGELH